MKPKTLRRIVIFGSTSAIAQAVARRFVSRGASLFCVGRNERKLQAVLNDLRVRATNGQRVEGMTADLTDISRHEQLIDAAEQALGGIDGVLIAHGSLPDQGECEQSVDQALKELQTNALSVAALLTALANRFEKQESGVLAVISSVAGDRGRKSNYVYGAAKGMVTLFMQGLRNRLDRKGVSVVTLKPGFVDTPMTAGFDKKGPLWATPETVAAGIVRAMERGCDEVYLPGFWRFIMLAIRHIPERFFKRMNL